MDRVFNDEESIRRLIARFADRRVLSVCYEVGPGGFELYRLLSSMGVACEVVAPSLIPKGSSDRVKTDRRDAIRLARLHRARQLTAIRVPAPAEEAVRDLVRGLGSRSSTSWRSTTWWRPTGAGLAAREAELAAVEAQLATWALAAPLAPTVRKLGAYRGIASLTGLTLAAEVGCCCGMTGGVRTRVEPAGGRRL